MENEGHTCTLLHRLNNRNGYNLIEQKNTNFISGVLKDRAIKATKDEHVDIPDLREEANRRLLHASVAAKFPNTDFLFLSVTFSP